MSFGLSLIERETPLKPWMSDYNFVLVQTIEHLKELVDKSIEAPYVAFDLESTGLDTRVFNGIPVNRVVGYSIAFEPKTCYYIPIRHKVETERGKNLPIKETNEQIQRLVNEAVVVGHNWLKYDAEMMLASDGITIKKFKPGEEITYHDSFVLARLAGKKPAGLKWLSKNLVGKEMIDIKEVVTNAKDIDFGSVSPYEGLVYAASDAICTKEIFEHPDIQAPIQNQKFIYNLERKVLYVVRNMERNKIKLNVEFCQQLDGELIEKIYGLQKQAYKIVEQKTEGKIKEFKLDSPRDVSDILFNVFDMNPKPEKGKNGDYKTDDATLEKLAANYELAKVLQEYRTFTKFHRTYVKNMLNNVDQEGYLKFQFSSLQTDSGRFASPGGGKNGDGCSGVNIQAIPARYDKSKPNVRKCLACDDDEVFVAMDWAGVELRIATNLSLEPIWLDRFVNGDGDLHTSTASIIFDKPELEVEKVERQTGKCVHQDSLLYVNGKFQRIGDIHSGRDRDTFYNLKDGYNVLVENGITEKIKQFYSNGETDTLLVCTRRGLTACSKNHRFELSDGTLVRAEQLEKGMTLKEIPFGIKSLDTVDKINFNPFLKKDLENDTFQININNDVSYFAGLFLGDGATSVNGSYLTSGNYGKYIEWQNTIKHSLNKIGLDCSVKTQEYESGGETRTATNLYIGSRHTNSVLNSLELVEENKKVMKIPSYILNGSKETKMAFLAGLIDADGTVSKDNNLTFTQKDWTLIQDCCVVLAGLGIHYSVEPRYNKTYEKYYFRIRIAKAHNSEFKKYMKCFWKTERLEEPKFKYSKYPENTVTEVITLDQHHLVDIGVDSKEHMYLVNNHRTHNTFNFQSVYGGGPGALASTLGITMDDAKIKQGKFFGRLKTLKAYIRSLQKFGQKNHYCLTKFGRRRPLPEYKSEYPKLHRNADRKATNTPIQGTAADLMKLAMVKIDEWIEENGYQDIIKMVITMHDELCFRIKKEHVDKVKELEEIMKLKPVLQKINWQVPLDVDVEVGDSWDIHYEYPDMLAYLKENYDAENVAYLYTSGLDYDEELDKFNTWLKAKKDAKKEASEAAKEAEAKITPSDRSKEDFKKMGNSIVKNFEEKISKPEEEPKKEEVTEDNFGEKLVESAQQAKNHAEGKIELKEEVVEIKESEVKQMTVEEGIQENVIENSVEKHTASAEDLDSAFKILQTAKLSDLPLEAHQKLRKSFYEQEIERILGGYPSTEDDGIEMPIVVHSPIDEMKKSYMGVILDTCRGNGRIKFVTDEKEELHEGWFDADVLKASVMAKIFNL